MEINIREVGSLSFNVSPVGELCTAKFRSENSQKKLIGAIYMCQSKNYRYYRFHTQTITSVYAAWFGCFAKKA